MLHKLYEIGQKDWRNMNPADPNSGNKQRLVEELKQIIRLCNIGYILLYKN